MLSILAAILMQAATPTPPSAAPPRPSVVTNPDWLHKPNGQDMAKYYPPTAAAAHIEGRAVLHCDVTAAGDLADCVTSDETPSGQGFGAAAISLAPNFKMRPMTKDGVPVSGGKINIPIAFRLPRSSLPATPVMMRCYGYAAAMAEHDPSSAEAQGALVAWRLLLELKTIPEMQRPSEFEGLIAGLRRTGAEHLAVETFKAEREECARLLPPTAGFLQDLQRMVSG